MIKFHELKEAYFNKNPNETESGKRDPDSKEHIGENVKVVLKRNDN